MVIVLLIALGVAMTMPLPKHARVVRHHLWRVVTLPFPDDAHGPIQAEGPTLGDFRMQVDQCDSGDWRSFYGIMFHDGSQPGFAGLIVLPEDGEPHLSINAPARDYAIEFTRSDCGVWDVDVKRTWSLFRGGDRRSGIQPMAGHARFSCYHPDTGARVDGDLRFRYCQ